jgi:hypothetical protein
MRTQFFASPGQAVLWAAIAAGVAVRLFGPRERFWLAGATGALVFVSVTTSLSYQVSSVPSGNAVDFAKLVYVYQQIHDQAPNFVPDTKVLLVSESFDKIPFKSDYNMMRLSSLVLGVTAISSAPDPYENWQPSFHPDGVTFEASPGWSLNFPYKDMVAFNLGSDGRVTLLRTLPAWLLPAGVTGAGYDPSLRIIDGVPIRLPFLRYPSWMKPYDPVADAHPDIVDATANVRLGKGWYDVETYQGQTFRWVSNDAEIVFMTSASRTLNLDLEPGSQGPHGEPLVIRVLDGAGDEVDEFAVTGRATVSMRFPARDGHFLYKLHVDRTVAATTADPRNLSLRVFGIKGDIIDPSADVELGSGWYPLETHDGQTFRWVNNDAQLFITPSGSREHVLNIQLEPAYRTDGQALRLVLMDGNGHTLKEYSVNGPETLAMQVPSGASESSYRLHVDDSAGQTDTDPRTLNFRVFKISEQDD